MTNNHPPVCLTIAGSDSGGGAGIQADLKTFAALGVFGCSAITAVTAQNTRTVTGIWPLSASAVIAQIEAVLSDFNVGAIKLGMLFSAELVEAIAAVLLRHPEIPVICDPVMVATTGASLAGEANAQQQLAQTICENLLPRAMLLTPNIEEAAALINTQYVLGRATVQLNVENELQKKAQSVAHMRAQAQMMMDAGANAVLIKGGHLQLAVENETVGKAVDLLCWRESYWREPRWRDNNAADQQAMQSVEFANDYIDTRNTHGTGCTLSSAIAAQIAKGEPLQKAVASANHYVHRAIVAAQSMKLGGGSGPLQHFH